MKRLLFLCALILTAALVSVSCAPARVADPPRTDPEQPTHTPVACFTDMPTPSLAPDTQNKPLLWRAQDENGHTLYLFGTIHVGDERTNTVMRNLSDILSSCTALAVEFDTRAYQNDAAAVQEDLARFVYRDGTKAYDHLPEDLYTRAKALLEETGNDTTYLDYYNLALWGMLLDQAALSKTSALSPAYGMDGLLIDSFYERALPVWNVESAALQYSLTNSFSDELNVLKIRSTLDDLDLYGENVENLYAAWLSGDEQRLDNELTGEDEQNLTEREKALLEDYDSKMLDERNQGMAQKAISYLSSGQTVFFAVGAAHYAGEQGVVSLLAAQGYTVQRVSY